MTPNNLPGFLRRSIRSINDEDDDSGEEIQPTAGSPHEKSLLPPSYGTDSPTDQDAHATFLSEAQEKISDELDQELELLKINDSIDQKFRMVATSHNLDKDTIAHSDTNADENTSKINGHSQNIVHGRNNAYNNNGNPPSAKFSHASRDKEESQASTASVSSQEETNADSSSKKPDVKNYKEEQFDKVISSPVVDIEDLRKSAWNGIPVSSNTMDRCCYSPYIIF
jgi:hypothetical protein